MPSIAPWLVVLALLILPANRRGSAWGIGVPLVLAALAGTAFLSAVWPGSVPGEVESLLRSALGALAFGAAAVWLLAPYLRSNNRFLAMLKVLMTWTVASGIAFLVQSGTGEKVQTIGFLVMLELCVLVNVISFALAGLLCRRRYRPFTLSIWLALFTAALPLAIAAPFVVLVTGMGGAGVPWAELLTGVLGIAIACYTVALLFLLLCFATPFYRQRLKELLHLESSSGTADQPALPPIVPPAAPQVMERKPL